MLTEIFLQIVKDMLDVAQVHIDLNKLTVEDRGAILFKLSYYMLLSTIRAVKESKESRAGADEDENDLKKYIDLFLKRLHKDLGINYEYK